MQYWVGFDVGIKNLAVVKIRIDEDFSINNVVFAEKIDLTQLKHNKIPKSECCLHHTNDAVDRIDHFLQEYSDVFKDVTKVFIERQPITGLVHIEQLLFDRFRSISTLVSPNAMHKHFSISHLDYDNRKVETEKIAKPYLAYLKLNYDRMHDIADAFCILFFQLQLTQEKQRQQQTARKLILEFSKFTGERALEDYFDQFRYIPRQTSASI